MCIRDSTKDRLEAVERSIAEKQAHREMVEQFLSELAKQDAVTEFTDELWYLLLGYCAGMSTPAFAQKKDKLKKGPNISLNISAHPSLRKR